MSDALARQAVERPPSETSLALRRLWGMVLRHWFLLRGSVPRMLEMAYWPVMQMITWGLVTEFFLTHSSWLVQASGMLLGAVLLWDATFRANLGLSMSFLEEMWSRNLGHLFVSPLRGSEYAAALTLISLLRTIVSVLPAALLAILLYEYNIFAMGLPLLAFFVNVLVTGWAVGFLVSALVLRYGLGAESIAWIGIFAIAPISGIYYPIETLPDWIEPIALALPPAHVFEGMRAVLKDGLFHWNHFYWAVGLNVVYITAAIAFFLRMLHIARRRGLFLSQGE